MRKLCRLLLLLALAGGVLAPPAICLADFLLFTSELEGTRGRMYRMGEDETFSFVSEFGVSWDSRNIAVSADGRVAAFGGIYTPMVSVLFTGAHGLVQPPIYFDHPGPDYSDRLDYNPVAFHHELPLFYAGSEPISAYRYSLEDRAIEPTGHTTTDQAGVLWNQYIGYSSHSNSIVYSRIISARPSPRISGVQTIRVNDDGSFGDVSTSCTLSTYRVYDTAVSPDGRWAAVVTQGNPKLYLARIESDGSPVVTDEITIPVPESSDNSWLAFTPDGRRVLMLTLFGTHRLSLFDLDETEGKLVRLSWVDENAPGWNMLSPHAVAVTPDGRHAAFASANPKSLSHYLISLVRIHEDGTLEYLNGKELDTQYRVQTIAFAPLPEAGVEDWLMYE